jgi:hypothetical protein
MASYKSLPKKHPLSQLAAATLDDWLTGNLTGSRLEILAGKLTRPGPDLTEAVHALALEQFDIALQSHDDQFSKKFPAPARSRVDAIIRAVGRDGLQVPRAEARVRPQVMALIAALGEPVEVHCVASEALRFEMVGGGRRNAGLYVALNTRSGEYVTVYVREGNAGAETL